MRPVAGQVLHFSEDPHITRFAPHVAATSQQPEPYVWAVDAEQAPAYWFPRGCPRVLAWPGPETTPADRLLLSDRRMHAIEYGWLPALRAVRLYAYRFDAAPFRPFGSPRAHAMVATTVVTPLGPVARMTSDRGPVLRLASPGSLAPNGWCCKPPYRRRRAGRQGKDVSWVC